ncbi:hypothetical protein [Propionimicrobium sp. PCR01-08-3]|uniref:hypothetical protein n=1 Tax=Propionimicrobium sp. PCR01-08-3 TaxID=3052086 RepID=UPI00255CDC23|nr:hypothetical protein [Propionimicrobium sp. PCR01-08-3]WIY82221.1 hypothetical protein QQ658_12040 [Propionimicrobium sp. PCR01-08-3]
MTTTTHFPPQERSLRALNWIGTALAVIVLSASLVWLAAPQLSPYAAGPNPAPIHHLFGAATMGQPAAALLQAAVSAAASVVGLIALFGRREHNTLIGTVAVVSGVLAAVGLVGLNGLAISGYTLSHALPFGIIALLVFVVRAPVARIIVAIAGAAAAVFLVVGPTPLSVLYRQFGDYLVTDPARSASPLLLLLFSGVWVLTGAMLLQRTPGMPGRFVLKHRVAITIAAACCALPYVIARLSWLTPWPLAGDPGDYADDTLTMATGLILGSGMLTGGILTLGLILPWGSRFPTWFGRVGGRPVPTPLAVVPSSIVAILFTTAGLDSLLLAGTDGIGFPVLVTAVVFPFWLWGPLLALATWGYALHRSTEAQCMPTAASRPYSTQH